MIYATFLKKSGAKNFTKIKNSLWLFLGINYITFVKK